MGVYFLESVDDCIPTRTFICNGKGGGKGRDN